MGQNRVRIIGGKWGSRLIAFPSVPGLRPTADRVRETLFNWLGQDLTGRRCLDLFAGSGALGFEALSRGAEGVVMVEANPKAFRALAANAEKLGAANLELVQGSGLKFLTFDRRKFDVIFLDPPYETPYLAHLLPRIAEHLAEDGTLYAEAGAAFDPGPGWAVWRSGRTGRAHYCLLHKVASVAGEDHGD